MKVLLQLSPAIINPGAGVEHKQVCADWEIIDDETYVVFTAYGELRIPAINVDYSLIVGEDYDMDTLPDSVWKLN